MVSIKHKEKPSNDEIKTFLMAINFTLPQGFIDFYKQTNGAEISREDDYIILWPMTDMIKLNKEYNVDVYIPDFFIIGSDGGDIVYAIEKQTGYIFDIPFIGMSKEEATLKAKTFTYFLNNG